MGLFYVQHLSMVMTDFATKPIFYKCQSNGQITLNCSMMEEKKPSLDKSPCGN